LLLSSPSYCAGTYFNYIISALCFPICSNCHLEKELVPTSLLQPLLHHHSSSSSSSSLEKRERNSSVAIRSLIISRYIFTSRSAVLPEGNRSLSEVTLTCCMQTAVPESPFRNDHFPSEFALSSCPASLPAPLHFVVLGKQPRAQSFCAVPRRTALSAPTK